MTDYEKYQLEWMIEHNYSLKDLIKAFKGIQYLDPENPNMISATITEIFAKWERDNEVYTAEDEWIYSF